MDWLAYLKPRIVTVYGCQRLVGKFSDDFDLNSSLIITLLLMDVAEIVLVTKVLGNLSVLTSCPH